MISLRTFSYKEFAINKKRIQKTNTKIEGEKTQREKENERHKEKDTKRQKERQEEK